MTTWVKPTILSSRCIEFDHCRYDGSMIASDFVKKIKPYVDFVTVCHEVEIGLGIPRKSLRLVQVNNEKRLIQPATNKDVTTSMISFAQSFLSEQRHIHGVILKTRSPSCGIKDVKVYAAQNNAASIKKTAGLFGEKVLQTFPGVVESEGRLRNSYIQEHFLVSIFTIASFDHIKKNLSMADLVKFHSNNKFLFMAYNQEILREMGRVVANQTQGKVEQVFHQYEDLLYSIFTRPPSHKTTINVLHHLFGFVSDDLNESEKSFFLDLVQKYREEKIPLTVVTHVLKSWVIRFAESYLSDQTFFNPFPEELLEDELSAIADKQRYWI